MLWLILVLAILSILFPPLVLVLLALLVMGVFAKGMQTTAEDIELFERPRRQYRGGRRWVPVEQGADDEKPEPAGPVIDVRSYPFPGMDPLPAPPADSHRETRGI